MQELHCNEIDQVSGGIVPLLALGYFAAGAATGVLFSVGVYIGYNEAAK